MGEGVTAAVTNLTTLAGNVIDFVTGNPLLCICLVAGTVIPAAFKLFRGAKSASK